MGDALGSPELSPRHLSLPQSWNWGRGVTPSKFHSHFHIPFFLGGGRPIRTWNLRDPYPPPLFEGRRGPGAGPDLPNGASRLFSRARRCERQRLRLPIDLFLWALPKASWPLQPRPPDQPSNGKPLQRPIPQGPATKQPIWRAQKQADRTLGANLNEKQAVSVGFTVLLTFV